MAADFTPLAQVLKAKLAAGPGEHDTVHFRPIAGTATASSGDTALFAKPQPASSPHRPVNLELKRDGDRITQIRITCRCGDLIELDCEY
jgi:hypothetical protein